MNEPAWARWLLAWAADDPDLSDVDAPPDLADWTAVDWVGNWVAVAGNPANPDERRAVAWRCAEAHLAERAAAIEAGLV